MINRFVSGRDGVQLLTDNEVIESIIKSYLHYTDSLNDQDAPFLIYLLESLTKIL